MDAAQRAALPWGLGWAHVAQAATRFYSADFADAISLHPVMSVNAGEHRLQRIKSGDPNQHRISYGCINVPAKFYEGVVSRTFSGTEGIVYVLPETRPVRELFGSQGR